MLVQKIIVGNFKKIVLNKRRGCGGCCEEQVEHDIAGKDRQFLRAEK